MNYLMHAVKYLMVIFRKLWKREPRAHPTATPGGGSLNSRVPRVELVMVTMVPASPNLSAPPATLSSTPPVWSRRSSCSCSQRRPMIQMMMETVAMMSPVTTFLWN